MSKPVLGAQLYTCRSFCKTIEGVAETFRKVAQIGYKTVQISGFGPVNPKDVAKLLGDTGLEVSCTHLGWKRFQTELDAVIEEHKLWKCTHLAVGSMPEEYFKTGMEGIKRFVDELTPIAKKLAKEGMDFSFHNHNMELAKVAGMRKPWLAALYETAPKDVLKAEIDTYWITAGGGDPAAWIKMCAGREPLVHFKDMLITPDREIRMAEIGEGNLNWQAIIQACTDGGVEYALVEQDNCYDRDPFESLKISLENLKKMGLS
ncbi:MAG: sugar phosphate isomerase/epimerase [Planctomycetes bacterium]|nr:sugar phosphate isomerase/epimerase [Planctomycetota bacterium]